MTDRQPVKAESPIVTGISPKDGIPGTQITIRGENLGLSQNDLAGVNICGADCILSARWESSRKIVARVNQLKAVLGDVIVTTRLGGKGTCTVQFRLFNVQIGPLQESAVWVDESRTVPALQRESNNASNLVDDDPLQLSSHNKNQKLPDGTFADLYPDGSSNIRLENFVPAWFLLDNYPNASLEELKTGFVNAQRQSSSMGREGPRDFLKSNLSSFVRCVNALSELKTKLDIDAQNPRHWPLCSKVHSQVNSSALQANKLFADVLERKERADATRSALSVLQRFKFLFFLPRNIEAHIDKGDYALIFNDYTRAKSLFSETDIPLFKEAYREVEQRVEKFRRALEEKLVEMPSTLDEQKKIIRYLLLLNPESDAGWTCLNASYHWLMGLLWDSQQKHHKAAVESAHLYDDDSDDEQLTNELTHRFYFVESVANVFNTKLQHFYKLGHAYIHGQLSLSSNLHKEDQVESMVLNVVQLGVWLVLNAILPENVPSEIPDTYKGRLLSWPDEEHRGTVMTMNLLQSLKTFRACVASLLQQDFSSKQLQSLYDLCVTLRLICLARVVEQTRQSIIDLQYRENWKITNRQKDDWSKTNSPDLFERTVNEVAPLLKQLVANSGFPGETDLLTQERLRAAVMARFERLYNCYEETLCRAARLQPRDERNVSLDEKQTALNRPTDLSLSSAAPQRDAPIKDRKLLIVLSNCDYTLRFSIPMCVDRLKTLGGKFSDQLRERCIPTYVNLRSLLLKMYISAKCAPFSALTQSYDYDMHKESLLDVSEMIKDILLCIVSVQAELFLTAPQFANQVMSFVVRNSAEQLIAKQGHKNAQHPDNSSIARLLDLTAFEDSIQYYLSADTKKMIDDAKKSIGFHQNVDSISSGLNRFRSRMRLAFRSLQDQGLSRA